MPIVLFATLLPLGGALLLLTRIVEFLATGEAVVIAGVVRKGLPVLSGSLFVGGSVLRVGIGFKAYRPNRAYYRLAIAWGG